MKIGVAKETAPGERRVALVPEALGKLTAAGLEVLVEKGAGDGAFLPDAAFTEAGAKIVSAHAMPAIHAATVAAVPSAPAVAAGCVAVVAAAIVTKMTAAEVSHPKHSILLCV